MATKKAAVKTKTYGVGLDMGTMNIVAARRASDGVETTRMRDVFLDLPANAKKMLKFSKTSFVDRGDEVLLLGDAALETANIFGREPRRPLASGLVSSSEMDSLDVLGLLVKHCLGEPKVPNEVCFFSVPADPVDQPDRDIIYHKGVLERIVTECGYDARPANEAMAIIFSECAEDQFSGLALSCLVPGTEVYTEKGIIPIESVQEGDRVLSHKGRWCPVTKVVKKQFEGPSVKLQITGWKNSPTYHFVDNHEIFVKRGGEWVWVGSDEVEKGDIVGEPYPRRDRSRGRPTITLCERTTSSSKVTKKHVQVTQDVQRLIGYFLGDGSVGVAEGCIQFDFGEDEEVNIQDVQMILRKNFGKESTVTNKSGRCVRIKCFSRGMVSYFKGHFYDEGGDKRYPWPLSRITDGDCYNLLVGLIRSDGWVSQGNVSFGNSSPQLAMLAKHLFSRVGLPASLSCREPRTAHLKDGRTIRGKKTEWQVTAGKKTAVMSLAEAVETLTCENSTFTDRMFIEDGFCCGRVQKVEDSWYEGEVYDLQVEGDHSFSGPQLTIHNCGSGMVNVALAINTIEGLSFSVARSGDYIDKGAAKSVGSTQARICAIKEAGIDLLAPKNREEEAIAFYYKATIEHALEQIAARFRQIQGQFVLPRPIPLVVSGGTSKPDNFMEFFKQVFAKKAKRFPIEISEIRQAADPLNAVAYGLLVQAMQEHDDDE